MSLDALLPASTAGWIAAGVLAASFALFVYTYFGYPAVLWALGSVLRRSVPRPRADAEWPTVSISVPAYDEEAQIRELIKSLLALDYPRDKLQILIVSDASADATDDIVREYASDGVELLRMEERGGKTRAEAAAAQKLRGDIVVNTDASIRIQPDSLKRLIAAFDDPRIGCASGRDVSVDPSEGTANVTESGYVGYEMSIRDLETRVSGIIGSSGCFYAIRRDLHRVPLPEALSRDFASALHTREHGFRPVSVPGAVCLVPRSLSLKKEYRRKVRTIARGMETLWYKRKLLNPLRYPVFAWMLVSHKVCRWALPWALMASYLAMGVLAVEVPVARVVFAAGTAVLLLAAGGWLLADTGKAPKLLSVPAFLVVANLAAAHALFRALQGRDDSLWEPTRRQVLRSPSSEPEMGSR